MLGKNKIARPSGEEGKYLNVVDIVRTIQGDAPYTGRAAVIIRLGGCHLRCTFCDTEFDNFKRMDVALEVVPEILDKSRPGIGLVAITGGEPLLQDISVLTRTLTNFGMLCQVDTAGVAELRNIRPGTNVLFVCSPKTTFVHPTVQDVCQNWKYPIRVGSMDTGRPVVQTHAHPTPLWFGDAGDKPPGRIWLQPITEYYTDSQYLLCDEDATRANQQYAAEMCVKYGYNLSLQTNRIVSMP